MDYIKILRDAYRFTMSNPLTWLFGLFLIGFFNFNFLHFQSLAVTLGNVPLIIQRTSQHLSLHHPRAISIVLTTFFLYIILQVCTSWARILLVLYGRYAIRLPYSPIPGTEPLQHERRLEMPLVQPSFKKLIHESSYFLKHGVAVGFLTTFATVMVAVGLFVPPLFWISGLENKISWLALATLLFIPFVFIVSCIHIFSVFFIVLYRKDAAGSLNLATDLLFTKWREMLGLVGILLVVYILSFFAATSFVVYMQSFAAGLGGTLVGLGILPSFAIITVTKIAADVILLIVLSILSVFFNTAFLLLFNELVKPVFGLIEKNPLHQVNLVPSSKYKATQESRF